MIIGYGSDIRRDDAAGRRVAEAVAACRPPRVEVRSLVQLTPELAVELVDRPLVVFVDAAVGIDQVGIDQLEPRVGTPSTTHHLEPRGLLVLAEHFGAPPARAVVVSVPARDLRIGTRLDPATEQDVGEATEAVLRLVRAEEAVW